MIEELRNPIDAFTTYITKPREDNSASLAESAARVGFFASVALLAIGMSLAQIPTLAVIGVSILPISMVTVLLFWCHLDVFSSL